MDRKKDCYLLALHKVPGLGPIRLKKLIDDFVEAEAVWKASKSELTNCKIPERAITSLLETRKTLDPQQYIEEIIASKLSWLTIFDEAYPKLLKEIYDPPVVFYYIGSLEKNLQKTVAVVGTRKITGYGKVVTEQFSSFLAGVGITVISGLARGVDTAAHRAAICAGGQTIAVLGGGLRKIFPPENIGLAQKIASGNGAVISEFPPDEPSFPGNFPARNRIISGLSSAVLITEAAADSGSLITAKFALEQGREVFAVPGPITSDVSTGTIELIKNGSQVATSPEEIVADLGWSQNSPGKDKSVQRILQNLSPFEIKVLERLANGEKHLDEVCRELDSPAADLSAALIKMEILGIVKNLGGGFYIRVC